MERESLEKNTNACTPNPFAPGSAREARYLSQKNKNGRPKLLFFPTLSFTNK